MTRTRPSNSNLASVAAALPIALRKRPDRIDEVTALAHELQQQAPTPAHAFDIDGARAHLRAADGGYEIVHESARLEIGIYVLVAPEPDQQRAHANDAVYVVLEGAGTLDVDGEQFELREGRAAFVPARADFRFSAYEQLSVLVISKKPWGDVQTSVGASPKPKT